MPNNNPTACLLVIGNEVLSGRTRDANIQFLATGLGTLGIPIRAAPVIPAVPETAMAATKTPGKSSAPRQRMATMPHGAALIESAISVAPGFQMENVYVMAGVPRVMQSMFEWLAPRLKGGAKIEMRAVHVLGLPEGVIADGLGAIQKRYPQLDLGSYPFYRPAGSGVALVAKGPDGAAAEKAIAEVTDL